MGFIQSLLQQCFSQLDQSSDKAYCEDHFQNLGLFSIVKKVPRGTQAQQGTSLLYSEYVKCTIRGYFNLIANKKRASEILERSNAFLWLPIKTHSELLSVESGMQIKTDTLLS